MYLEEEFEDTKWVIRVRKSKKERHYNGQKKKDKRTNNDLQNITHKTKDRVTRTPRKTVVKWLYHVSNIHVHIIISVWGL